MKVDAFLSRLEKVKRTGNGTWIACCPAHEDKSPSMTIRETEDSVVLIHCFAGCDAGAIVGSVGMELHDLFPDREKENLKPIRRAFPAADVLEALSFETMVIAVTAGDLATHATLTDEARHRMWVAFQRIDEGRRLALG